MTTDADRARRYANRNGGGGNDPFNIYGNSGNAGASTGGGGTGSSTRIPYPGPIPPGYVESYEFDPVDGVYYGTIIPDRRPQSQGGPARGALPSAILNAWPTEDPPDGQEWAWNPNLNNGAGGMTLEKVPYEPPKSWQDLAAEKLAQGDEAGAQKYFDFYNQLPAGAKVEFALQMARSPGDYVTLWSLYYGSQSPVAFKYGTRRIPFVELMEQAGWDTGIIRENSGRLPSELTDTTPGIEDPTADIHGADGAAATTTTTDDDTSIAIEEQPDVEAVDTDDGQTGGGWGPWSAWANAGTSEEENVHGVTTVYQHQTSRRTHGGTGRVQTKNRKVVLRTYIGGSGADDDDAVDVEDQGDVEDISVAVEDQPNVEDISVAVEDQGDVEDISVDIEDQGNVEDISVDIEDQGSVPSVGVEDQPDVEAIPGVGVEEQPQVPSIPGVEEQPQVPSIPGVEEQPQVPAAVVPNRYGPPPYAGGPPPVDPPPPLSTLPAPVVPGVEEQPQVPAAVVPNRYGPPPYAGGPPPYDPPPPLSGGGGNSMLPGPGGPEEADSVNDRDLKSVIERIRDFEQVGPRG